MVTIKNILKKLDLTCVYKITEDKINHFNIIPIYEEKDHVEVILLEERREGIDYIEFLFGKKVKFKRVSKDEFYLIKGTLNFNKKKSFLEEDIIINGIKNKGSDIHFEPRKEFVNVRLRVDGVLNIVKKLRLEEYNQILSRIKIKGNMDIAEKRKPQDGKIVVNNSSNSYDCRISTIPTIYGEKLVIRILYKDKLDYSIDSLNLTMNQLKDLEKIINIKNGIVMINGPTGSGKSTTLYSILNSIKDKDINITTIEDPVECYIEGVNQININRKIKFDFAEGLRSTLRQDPDVIMVGEIRDEETAKMAIRAAITGHKVYSTIHTKSAREVFLRLEDMNIKNYLIKDSLVGIISQRLVGCLCNNCKKEYIKKINGKEYKFYNEVGCSNCNFTGIKGRRLICAVHFINGEIKNKIKEIYNNLEILSNKQMFEVSKILLFEGVISYKEYKEFIEGEELSRYEYN